MNTKEIKIFDDGVSESIGFLLIFSMVIIGIGLVTLYGYPMLLREQTSADEQIMQKSMIVLQNDVKSLTFKTVPYKETMLNTGGGSLTLYNSSESKSLKPSITIMHGIQPVETNFLSGSLRYASTSADSVISLQNGAVLSHKLVEQGSVMTAQPRWFYDGATNTMVVNLISFNSSAVLSKGGLANVQMRMKQTNYSVLVTSDVVCLGYTPDTSTGGDDYSLAWDTYFTRTVGMVKGGCSDGDFASVDYRLPVTNGGTLVVKKYDVEIVTL
jgi:hypothetical protein